jgi:hypothetical protein
MPQAIPRITSKGMVCGAVYKVASAQQLLARDENERAHQEADVQVL